METTQLRQKPALKDPIPVSSQPQTFPKQAQQPGAVAASSFPEPAEEKHHSASWRYLVAAISNKL